VHGLRGLRGLRGLVAVAGQDGSRLPLFLLSRLSYPPGISQLTTTAPPTQAGPNDPPRFALPPLRR
jgi:hypothetical protein